MIKIYSKYNRGFKPNFLLGSKKLFSTRNTVLGKKFNKSEFLSEEFDWLDEEFKKDDNRFGYIVKNTYYMTYIQVIECKNNLYKALLSELDNNYMYRLNLYYGDLFLTGFTFNQDVYNYERYNNNVKTSIISGSFEKKDVTKFKFELLHLHIKYESLFYLETIECTSKNLKGSYKRGLKNKSIMSAPSITQPIPFRQVI